MQALRVCPQRTEIFRRGGDLASFVERFTPPAHIREGVMIAITSKIVSLAENRLVKAEGQNKRALVEREADVFLGEIGHGCLLTVKHGVLIPSAGIDESNSESGEYILYPEDPFASAEQLCRELKSRWSLQNLAVLITDSRTTLLRRGVTGICLSYAGFKAMRSLVGQADLFGRQLRMTQMNLVDGLAAAAVLMMGEGAECQPLAFIEGAPVEFSELSDRSELLMKLEDDLYFPLLEPLVRGPI